MNADVLKGTLQIKGYTIPKIVEELPREDVEMTRSTFYKKMRGESEFTAKEITAIAKIAGLTKEEVYSIFFKDLVS